MSTPPSTLHWPHLVVDLERSAVRFTDDTSTVLTPLEAGLLAYLAAHPRRPVPARELLTEVWGYRSNVQSRAVTFAVKRLRTKLERSGGPRILETVRGRGLRLVVPSRSPLIGRDEALRELDEAIRGPERWIGLHGVAGVGKTAVVAHWAETRGASLVDASDGGLDGLTVALGLADSRGTREVRDNELVNAIASSGDVFVLDGLDTVPPSIVRVLDQLTDGRVVVVSRVPTGRDGLTLPPLSTRAARQLFRAEVDSRTSDWAASDEEVDWIVERLGRLPRPLLLTARSAPRFPPDVLSRRLVEHLAVWPPDQAVAGAIAWATDQLDADAHRVFRALAVCADGVTVEDLEGMDVSPDPLGALALLQQTGLVVGDYRVRLAAGVRPVALQALQDSDDAETLRAAHRRWFLSRTDAWRQHLKISDSALDLDPPLAARALRAALPRLPAVLTVRAIRKRIEAVAARTAPVDHSLRAYLAWTSLKLDGPVGLATVLQSIEEQAAADNDAVAASQAACFLGALQLETQQSDQARRSLERAVDHVGTPAHTLERGRARSALAIAVVRCGDLVEAHDLLTKALVDVAGDPAGTVLVRSTLGTLHLQEGRLDEAAHHSQLALDQLDRLDGSPAAPTRAVLLSNLGVVRMAQGALDDAARLHELAAAAHRRSGRARSLGLALASLARVHQLLGALPRAIDGYREAVERLERAGAPDRTLWTRVFLFGALVERKADAEAQACRVMLQGCRDQDLGPLAALLRGYDALAAAVAPEPSVIEDLLAVSHAELRPHRDRLLLQLRRCG